MLGPPSPPTPGTDHRSAPSAVSEYRRPVEPTTATLPSGATAGAWRTYWPSTSKRHLTSPEAAGAGAANATAASAAMTTSNGLRRVTTGRESLETDRSGSAICTDLEVEPPHVSVRSPVRAAVKPGLPATGSRWAGRV